MNTLRIFQIFFLLSLTACSYPMEEVGLFKKATPELPNVGTLEYADQKISFDVLKSTSLRTCLICHTSGRNAMGTPEQALAMSKTILEEVNSNQMPPKSSGYKNLTDCEKQILETWFDDQANKRESAKIKDLAKCSSMTAPTEETKVDLAKVEVTFTNLKKYILAPKCLSCHAHDVEKVETVLDSVEGMKEADVLGATAAESKLYQIVLPTAKRQMPPAKSGVPRLTTEEQEFLKKWIDAGAKGEG